MTDRELLELAARAVGAKPWDERAWPGICLSDDTECPPFEVNVIGNHTKYWLPLRDDGDALRLAVELKLIVSTHDSEAWAQRLSITIKQPIEGDPCAASRRAIVRAAAAIAAAKEGAQQP